jgi:1-acyl-sn-glycerol-3-phosphate acyltransferase
MVGEVVEQNLKTIGRAANEYGVDPFGFSVEYTLSVLAPLIWIYRNYHRVEVHGIDRVPHGRVLLVSNHSGQIPMDAMMIGIAMLTEGKPPRAIRSMVEKWVQTLPYISTFMARVGQIVGTPENCRRLLGNEEAILVFPEGVSGIAKLYRDRYQLQNFGLGFMRLALETQTPIVPIAVIGAEEQSPALVNLKPVAKMMGFPVAPLTVTGIPVPLPTKYRIYFGEPLHFTGGPDDDDDELQKKVHHVRAVIQSMLERGLSERKHVFW